MGFILVLVFALSLSGCGSSAIATVNGEKISEESYQEYLENVLALYDVNGIELADDELVELKSYVIEELIYREIILQGAEELGVTPTDEEAQTYFEEQLALTYGDTQSGLDIIEEYGLNEDFFYDSYFLSLAQTKISENLVAESTMTDEEAQAVYEENPDSWNTVEVSHILIAPVSTAEEPETDEDGNTIYTDEEWATAKATAEDIVQQLNDGADFAELATSESDDSYTAADGGALGDAFSKESSSYVEEFTEASFALENVGDYTAEPVKSDYGYHIILLTAKVDSSDMETLLQTIKDDQLATDRDTAFSEYIATKQTEAVIERFDEEEEETTDDTTTDDTVTDDTTTDDTTTDDTTTDDTTTDDTTTDDTTTEE